MINLAQSFNKKSKKLKGLKGLLKKYKKIRINKKRADLKTEKNYPIHLTFQMMDFDKWYEMKKDKKYIAKWIKAIGLICGKMSWKKDEMIVIWNYLSEFFIKFQ